MCSALGAAKYCENFPLDRTWMERWRALESNIASPWATMIAIYQHSKICCRTEGWLAVLSCSSAVKNSFLPHELTFTGL